MNKPNHLTPPDILSLSISILSLTTYMPLSLSLYIYIYIYLYSLCLCLSLSLSLILFFSGRFFFPYCIYYDRLFKSVSPSHKRISRPPPLSLSLSLSPTRSKMLILFFSTAYFLLFFWWIWCGFKSIFWNHLWLFQCLFFYLEYDTHEPLSEFASV